MSPGTRKPRKTRRPSSKLPTEITVAVAAALDKKALDVAVLDLRKGRAFTDFFVLATGASSRQAQAVADGVRAALAQQGYKPTLVEGESKGDWILLDYFDFIVHVFTPATREFYGLERLWGDAERIEITA
jgi:ribosome-associated protein